jgi:hypothetical protein
MTEQKWETSSVLVTSQEFYPAQPPITEKLNAPFQESRLLMGHLSFLNYEFLKDGSFQMLQKSAGLFRDLRGLDRMNG